MNSYSHASVKLTDILEKLRKNENENIKNQNTYFQLP